ncbi:MAG: hypothetical protein HQL52_17500 [Magnetococcales bacterium]|nr:hypothetical protein [Magnetococcales bacterium]
MPQKFNPLTGRMNLVQQGLTGPAGPAVHLINGQGFLDGLNQVTSGVIIEIPAPSAGYATSTGIRITTPRTAGDIHLQLTRNGTPLVATDLHLHIDATNTQTSDAQIASGNASFRYEQGDTIGLVMTSTAFTPLAQRIDVYVGFEG